MRFSACCFVVAVVVREPFAHFLCSPICPARITCASGPSLSSRGEVDGGTAPIVYVFSSSSMAKDSDAIAYTYIKTTHSVFASPTRVWSTTQSPAVWKLLRRSDTAAVPAPEFRQCWCCKCCSRPRDFLARRCVMACHFPAKGFSVLLRFGRESRQNVAAVATPSLSRHRERTGLER